MSSLAETPEYQAFMRYLDMYREVREMEPRVKELKETMRAMQPALLAYLASANLKSLNLNNYTISTHREPWVYPVTGVSKQRVCEALKVAGLGRMVKEDYSTQSLTAYVKQLEERAHMIAGLEPDSLEHIGLEDLPGLHPALAEILKVQAAYSLHIRKKEDRSAKTQYAEEGDDDPNDK